MTRNVDKQQLIEGIGNKETSIDREKCFPYFNITMGCAICIKECPFSKADGSYDKLKQIVERKKLTNH